MIENRIYLFDSVPVLLFARNHESVVVVVAIIIIVVVVVVIMIYFFLKVITSIQIWYLHILKKR